MAPGRKTGGKIKGSKNKATLEREEAARIERERVAELERTAAQGATELDKAMLQGKKLMKQIAFDFAEQFAGLAAYYQPVLAADGTLTGNPRFNEEKFKEYAVLARDTALGAAAYQSPKLAAVAVGVDANDPLRLKDLSLEEIRQRIAEELEKLGPILNLEAIRDPQGIKNRRRDSKARTHPRWRPRIV